MASIIKRKKAYSVVYSYTNENGETKQKWETWHTHKEALKRKAEIENQQNNGTFVIPNSQKICDYMYEFVSLYGEKKWGVSTYDSNCGLIANYINPIIGDLQVQEITTRVADKFVQTLPNVVFHSLRHSSTTYKLKLNHGDLKATQGDTGHSQINMITDVYAHILDEDRKVNAQKFESAFYANPDLRDVRPPQEKAETTIDIAALIEQLQANPELAATLAGLIGTAKK